ncbi:hypothetical protein AAFN86_00075 [Roseomonas sp. CAU 1739]|uniref:hypothetical protein n=1 Tax=Roseomonas sp. CAU 1739 TaxID=3140364 RepID=UPI00325BF2BD
MFYKTRMRRLLRRMIEDAAPAGLRPDPATVVERALMYERVAIAFGLTWYGLSAAQGALVIVLGACALGGLGVAEAERLEAAARRFAQDRGLESFMGGIARDIARIEPVAALHRVGPSLDSRSGSAELPIPG